MAAKRNLPPPPRGMGARLRKVRRALGLRIEQAAEKCGITPERWRVLEAGERWIGIDELDRMDEALGTSKNYIMQSRGGMFPDRNVKTPSLRGIRKRVGLSLAEAAKRGTAAIQRQLGTPERRQSAAAWRRWERGEEQMTADDGFAVAAALGVHPLELREALPA